MTETISRLLAGGDAAAPAIRGTNERPSLTFGALRELCARTVKALNAMGIGRGDRVAIVLPNGPEMAAAFLAIGAGATTAPLNPAYRAEEFTFYLTDLEAKALVVLHGMASDAREVAARLSIPVLDLIPDEAAGDFT
ncbi:MAG: AMP-binding protein, partial [Roseomonas sp.]|nr:AMP-binding protein [Roseomonas sp.]